MYSKFVHLIIILLSYLPAPALEVHQPPNTFPILLSSETSSSPNHFHRSKSLLIMVLPIWAALSEKFIDSFRRLSQLLAHLKIFQIKNQGWRPVYFKIIFYSLTYSECNRSEKSRGREVCRENLRGREGFQWVCSYNHSSSEYVSLIGWNFFLTFTKA